MTNDLLLTHDLGIDCGVDHNDATCTRCHAEHVEVGWAHVCRECWASRDA